MIRLTEENLSQGIISFREPRDENDKYFLEHHQKEFNGKIIKWLREDKKDFVSEQQVEDTDELFELILTYRNHKLIVGILRDKDLEEEIKELRIELQRCNEKYEKEHQNNIILAGELEDRNNIVESYEKGSYKKKE